MVKPLFEVEFSGMNTSGKILVIKFHAGLFSFLFVRVLHKKQKLRSSFLLR